MSNDIKTESSFQFRKELADRVGTDVGTTIYKHLTENPKYTLYNFSYIETKQVVDTMYGTIYELLYKDRYGDKTAKALMEHKAIKEENEKKEE